MSFKCVRYTAILLLSLTTLASAQLGNRVLEQTPDQVAWQTSDQVTCKVDGQTVIATLGDVDNSWFATQNQYPLNDQTSFEIQCSGGAVGMQFEWFTSRGRFLSATDVLKASDFAQGKQSLIVNNFIPDDIREKVRIFRPKFWLYGKNHSITITHFAIHAPRQFRTDGLQLSHKWEAPTKLTPDPVLKIMQDKQCISLELDPSAKHAGLVFEDRVPYDDKGVMMIDINSITRDEADTSLAIQTICWDKQGNYLTSVDLIKNMNKAGTYEIAPSAYGSAIPKETVKINFKVWIWGNTAKCKINGVYWGIPKS
ncbi:MAG TPA: hypothetical protein DCM28_18165 [Phycisphaerales bacterium]|nr:hypothetical protein [Phycisphaerales bacterium]HCD34406.1 hypothetical protein [Phycisphaerales bacterium]